MTVLRTFEHMGKTLILANGEETIPAMEDISGVNKPETVKIQISPIQLSTETLRAGETLRIAAQVRGKQIAYIYVEVMFYDQSRRRLYGPLIQELLRAEEEKETGGMIRPKWGNLVKVTHSIKPTLRLLSDGKAFAIGLLSPERYAATEKESTFLASGVYTFASNGEARRAELAFDGRGALRKVKVFKKSISGTETPSEVTPSKNDQFAPYVTQYHPPEGERVLQQDKTLTSNPLTFDQNVLQWIDEVALPGVYYGGYAVKDFDGHFTRKYATFSVQ